MAIISTIKFTYFPMKTELFRITQLLKTATIYPINRKNISLKSFNNKKFPPRVALQDNSVSNGSFITVENYQLEEQVQKIKQIMARKLKECCHVQELVIIDAIQRLGLEYYFRYEIRDALRKYYGRFITMEGGRGLHDTSLCFRLLRQQGYNVSSDTFSKFMDKDGQFKQEFEKDIKGLINLFEASHLKLPGDHILDYAGDFSQNLLSNFDNLEPFEASIIQNTLSLPYHKSLPRFMAMDFLQNFELSMKLFHDYRGDCQWMEEVSNLARIHITRDQITIKQEIDEICRWWEELRLPEELKLARSEPVKWHMWSVACLPGPNMAELRLALTKAISFIYIIDDIFDIYGTHEELTLFTETVNRWDIASFDKLPDYMIICLRELYDITNEISNIIYAKHGTNPKYHLKKVWAEFCNACLVQSNWIASGYMPTTEVYMKNEIATTGSYIAHVHIFFLLGEVIKDPNFLSSHPDLSSLAATILRLWDDLGSSKDEHQTHDGSVIDCYMNEHEGSSPESARQYVLAMIPDAWSRLNETLVSPSPFSADYKAAITNFARIVPIMYKYDEKHRLLDLEKLMQPLVSK
ncbi:(3S,6E)-nerolidol synthase 1-like isoform X2 [Silene latifolia]|uniref:(3S,6E)-nerolidol synthase 1-like isoform X2 n=1 Tax=Silene latifolia TaxID=37657 RepID=UPI003D77CB6A